MTEANGVQTVEIDIEGNGALDVDMSFTVVGSTLTASDISFVSQFLF